MNQEQILGILPSSEAEARSVKEMELDTSSYTTWRKTERGLSFEYEMLVEAVMFLLSCRIIE